jgi:hypothetical protein
MIDYSDIEDLIGECFEQMQSASREKYDSEKADKTAALFLMAELKVSLLIEDIEMKSRGAKNEISRIEGEKYFEYKTKNTDKKITENMMSSYLSKDADIISAKAEYAKHESNLKKWNYILDVLKDGHIYFRNIGKNKVWSE